MSAAINWAKSNVIIVLCILVMLLSIGSFFYPTGAAVDAYQNEINQVARLADDVRRYVNASVQVPSAKAGAEPLSERFTVNDAAVSELHSIFLQMKNGYGDLFNFSVRFNRDGLHFAGPQAGQFGANPHQVLTEGLFPKPETDSARFIARGAYKDRLAGLYAAIGAGEPPAPEELAQRLAELEEKFRTDSPIAVDALRAEQQEQLNEQKLETQRDLIKSRARAIRVYAPRPFFVPSPVGTIQGVPGSGRDSGRAQTGPGGLFDVGEWAMRGDKPTDSTLWEAQMNLWIQQDLSRVIDRANQGSMSVVNSPVKRVIAMTVKPGYIGVGASDSAGPSFDPYGSGSTESTEAPTRTDGDLNEPIKSNFIASPTGRVSNPLYDVRQADLSVIVASRDLPKLMNAFGRVNFMTPIINRITDIDEYAEFAAGYYYGDVDVIQVDLTVESIWLRRWTAGQTNTQAISEYEDARPGDTDFAAKSDEDKIAYLKEHNLMDLGLMPDVIRWQLGMTTRDPNFRPEGEAGQPGFGGPEGYPGGYGPEGGYGPYGP